VTGNRAITLTPQLIRESLENSLGRLQTDHVDLYFLHNATPDALADEAILRTLEDLRTSGKTRAIGVASDQTAVRLAMAANGVFDVVQLALADVTPAIERQARAANIGLIAHSVFGVDATLSLATARLAREPELRARLRASGLQTAADAMLVQARMRNPDGIILSSTTSTAHLRATAKMFERRHDAGAQTLVRDLFENLAGRDPQA
jgi:aryl-alcohol dehydrogenase-like predicted oxidoreductase